MTPAQLRARLAALLASQLGTYAMPNGGTIPAIYVGEPPANWTASGLEVRIEPLANVGVQFVHSGVGIQVEYPIRLIPRNATHALTAVQRIVQAFDTGTPRRVPANEALGIHEQYTLTIRS